MSGCAWNKAGFYRSACNCITKLRNNWAHCHSRQLGLGPGRWGAERQNQHEDRAKVGSGYTLIKRSMIQPRWPLIDPKSFIARRRNVLWVFYVKSLLALSVCLWDFLLFSQGNKLGLRQTVVGCKLLSYCEFEFSFLRSQSRCGTLTVSTLK